MAMDGAPGWHVPGGNVLGYAVRPVGRTARYWAQSWREYLGGRPDGLSTARPTLALAAPAFRDEVVLLGLRAHRPLSDPQAFQRITGEVVAALKFYGRKGWLDKPAGFFATPPPLTGVTVRQVGGRRGS